MSYGQYIVTSACFRELGTPLAIPVWAVGFGSESQTPTLDASPISFTFGSSHIRHGVGLVASPSLAPCHPSFIPLRFMQSIDAEMRFTLGETTACSLLNAR